MQIFNTIKGISGFLENYRCVNPDKKVAFVPTMGFLHEGHLSLFRKAKETGDLVVVSIFVNPIQFNNKEDYEKYPVNTEKDISLAEHEGVDVCFLPGVQEIYGDQTSDLIQLRYPDLMNRLCGKTRPGHFEGVLLIVHNLFTWIKPHYAVFGCKDYQQLILIQRMTRDLHLDVEIIAMPIIREKDGLAMSSRNARLSPENRKDATVLSQSLLAIRDAWKKNPDIRVKDLKGIYEKYLGSLRVDYAGIYHPHTLDDLPEDAIVTQGLAAVAAYCGEVRLIDNMFMGGNCGG